MLNIKIKYFLLSCLALLSLRCNTTDPPVPGSLSIKLEQISCTEAWLRITTDVQLPVNCTLKANTNSKSFVLSKSDTVVCVDSLAVNKSINFKAELNDLKISSPEVSGVTKDTTSHHFTSQSWVFGDNQGSVLYDVAIINENDIWAVGEIYIKDSLGQFDPDRYNAVHWNGSDWSLKRIPYYYNNDTIYTEIRSIFDFGNGELLFAGNGVIKWNGNDFIPIPTPLSVWGPYMTLKIWGISSNNFYIVGEQGSIAHYQSGNWIKIQSGTTAAIHDIWGDNEKLLCAASSRQDNFDYDIISIDTRDRASNFNWLTDKRAYSVWFEGFKLFACGDGMYIMNDGNNWMKQSITPNFKDKVRGSSLNNIFLVGDFGLLAHYNGSTWKEYPEYSDASGYFSVDINDNIAVVVGYIQTGFLLQAVVQILRR